MVAVLDFSSKAKLVFLNKCMYFTMSVFVYRDMETLGYCCGQLEVPELIASFDRASAGAFPEEVILSELWLSASQKLHPRTSIKLLGAW